MTDAGVMDRKIYVKYPLDEIRLGFDGYPPLHAKQYTDFILYVFPDQLKSLLFQHEFRTTIVRNSIDPTKRDRALYFNLIVQLKT